MSLQVPADLRARAEKHGIKIETYYTANFAYPEGEPRVAVQTPWDDYPKFITELYQIEDIIWVIENPINP